MSKRTVLKVDTSCEKCKRKVLRAVSGLQGVDKIEIDSEKGTVTVTGNVDPIAVIVQTRKAGRRAEVVTIGPPPKPEEKKPEQKKPEQQQKGDKAEKTAPPDLPVPEVHVHHCNSWPTYQRVLYHDDPPPCSIL